MKQNTTNKHFGSFYIAGFTFWDGCMAFNQLKVGKPLKLVREESNRYDPNAVAIYYEGYKLGFVPRTENERICQFLDLGYSGIFDVRVQQLSPDAHPEKQVGVVVFLNKASV
jgi:hypothetical protein